MPINDESIKSIFNIDQAAIAFTYILVKRNLLNTPFFNFLGFNNHDNKTKCKKKIIGQNNK